jgi:hypothetical protein
MKRGESTMLVEERIEYALENLLDLAEQIALLSDDFQPDSTVKLSNRQIDEIWPRINSMRNAIYAIKAVIEGED